MPNSSTDLPNATSAVPCAAPVLPNLYCTVVEFAESLKVSKGTVFTWIRHGLPSLVVGRTRRIVVERAYRWLEAGGADRTRKSTRARRTSGGPRSPSTEQ